MKYFAQLMRFLDLLYGRVDAAGWPTRDAAVPQEEC